MRNHDVEFQDNPQRQYAYDFDNVVRGYMMRTLGPYFRLGRCLEIGCFDGSSTRLLFAEFDDLVVLEASSELIDIAKANVDPKVRFVNGRVEDVEFEEKFDNIFIVHTLEHIDDPVLALAKLKKWLSFEGRLFVVVPNAMAASRQIAVRMGIVETNNSVTPGERAHGHRRTYSQDTLEADVRRAELCVEARGGIMFKPFANFQFDRLMNEGIVDHAYIDACYSLGMQYPELTASLYMVCRRNPTEG